MEFKISVSSYDLIDIVGRNRIPVRTLDHT